MSSFIMRLEMHFRQILPSSGSVICLKNLQIKLYDMGSKHQKNVRSDMSRAVNTEH